MIVHLGTNLKKTPNNFLESFYKTQQWPFLYNVIHRLQKKYLKHINHPYIKYIHNHHLKMCLYIWNFHYGIVNINIFDYGIMKELLDNAVVISNTLPCIH